jgi:flavin-dependent dehydrogenase
MEDVVIIGAGIAGLFTARFLSENGISPLVIEEHEELGMKPCGEGVQDKKVAGYHFLDLYGSRKGIERYLEFGEFWLPYFGSVLLHYPLYTIDKKTVEYYLLKKAKRGGARFVFGKKVQSLKRIKNGIELLPQEIRGKIVVGADGFNSVPRKFIGEKIKEFGFGISGSLDGETNEDEYKVFLMVQGYSWIFPKEKKCNVGIGVYEGSLKDELKTRWKEFRRRFNYGSIKNIRCGVVPLGIPCKSYDDNLILIGDSCSQVLPSSGSGNVVSAICAKIASEIIVEALRRNRYDSFILSKYEERWKEKLGDVFLRAYKFKKKFLFYSKRPLLFSLLARMLQRFIQHEIKKNMY